jgi:hypothetical protein
LCDATAIKDDPGQQKRTLYELTQGESLGGISNPASVNTQNGRDPDRTGQGHAFLIKSTDGMRPMLLETDGVQVNAMHVGRTELFPTSKVDVDGSFWVISCEGLRG